MLEAFIYVLATLYFWKVNKHWFYFVLIGYTWNVISVVGMYWMPESPRFLLNVGKREEAFRAFQTIAKWNKKELVFDETLFSNISASAKAKEQHTIEIKVSQSSQIAA